MNQQEWQKIDAIIDTALELEGDKRTAFIDEQCKGDEELKTQVTELLESIENSDTENFLEGSAPYPKHLAADLAKTEDKPQESSLIGATIDSYRILELVGHGGMASVFLAERADEVYKGKVALKLMRQGMDTPSNKARFKRERNILANLEHPNIARLLDGGVTDKGLPYLVMEYVDGTPLYTYCDEHNLTIEQRLDLFKSICQAVQYAHKNAVIHRDLKPANILVKEDGTVKVLDFGIAKLLEPEDPDETLFQTRTGARMLTLGYAAPEQINNDPITTSTDIYSLGVVLYELLAAASPFNMEGKNLSEIESLIRTKTPEKPSSKYGELSQLKQDKAASQRVANPDKISRKLKGDLDAIVMKTLRKNPDARYSSVDQLLQDLDRLNNNLPLIARKDTIRYKISKFLKRHKTGISAAAGFILLLAGFAGFHTWQITEERNRAQEEAQKARTTLDYLIGVFQHANPNRPGNQDITAQQILEQGTEYIQTKVKDQPDIKAPLTQSIGMIYLHLGEYDKAETLLREALTLNKKFASKESRQWAASLNSWGEYNMEIGKYDTAKKYFKKSAAVYNSLGNKNKYASIIGELGWIDYRNGDYERADSLLRKALEINRTVHGSESRQAGTDLQYLGWIKNAQGQYDKADSLFREALSIRKSALGENHRLVAQTLQSLGRTLYNKNDYAKAEEIERQALDLQQRIYDQDHPDIATSLRILGLINMRQEEFPKAKTYFEDALDMRLNFLGEHHPDVLKTQNDLGSIHFFEGNYMKAADLFKQVVASNKEVRGPDHPEVATSLNNLAMSLRKADRKDEAIEYYKEALEIGRKNYSEEHPKLIQFQRNTAILYEELNEYQKASALWLQNFNVLKQKNGLNNSDAKEALNHLITCHRKLGNAEKVDKYNSILAQTDN
ncbi:serine/threonine-protein kinase [Fodinibius sp.]|uniref:serine/threonine-protein kinase n=1 Tax=Fodinibius sp. TaxID=1872440 RepID=UPI002ACE1ABF|nr:serine/threonine-protein kinase [Fodinibius sp.]MDZ7657902.1 serine/threonine-protein kinase [Fodinibius sp.]MDZ7657907.1 serine/threonine-protein kinase [Fodinibius sp.]